MKSTIKGIQICFLWGPFCLEWETLVLPSPFLRASHIEEDSFPLLPYKRELKRKEYHQLLITDGTPFSKMWDARKKVKWEYNSFPLHNKKRAPTTIYLFFKNYKNDNKYYHLPIINN